MIYFDTAYIVKCYISERGSKSVRSVLYEHQTAACCLFGRLELPAALKRAVRENRLDARVLDTVYTVLEDDDRNGVWDWLPVPGALIQLASQEVRALRPEVPIRSGDALHLVCARESGFREIYSSDRHLCAAARYFGLAAVNIIAEE